MSRVFLNKMNCCQQYLLKLFIILVVLCVITIVREILIWIPNTLYSKRFDFVVLYEQKSNLSVYATENLLNKLHNDLNVIQNRPDKSYLENKHGDYAVIILNTDLSDKYKLTNSSNYYSYETYKNRKHLFVGRRLQIVNVEKHKLEISNWSKSDTFKLYYHFEDRYNYDTEEGRKILRKVMKRFLCTVKYKILIIQFYNFSYQNFKQIKF